MQIIVKRYKINNENERIKKLRNDCRELIKIDEVMDVN